MTDLIDIRARLAERAHESARKLRLKRIYDAVGRINRLMAEIRARAKLPPDSSVDK